MAPSSSPENQSGNSPKHFHIFGQGISFSRSPAIHTAAFRHYDLPYTYDIRQTATIDEVASLIEDESFGGASVTMPHKLSVHVFCDKQTEHAINIGAVNTLVVKHDHEGKRLLLGDNTDWSALRTIINKKTRSWSERPRSGLVIGAGGASRAALYAMYQCGLKEIFVVNRTVANAEKVAADFNHIFDIKVVQNLNSLPITPGVIIGTIPADKTSESDFQYLFNGPSRNGLCIDMAYKPRKTPLLTTAAKREGWAVVSGVEVLLNQAFDQFEYWTGLKAPEDLMEVATNSDDPVKGASL